MDVSAQPDVVSQIPAVVVRIFIDHDIVGTPVPVVAISEIIGRNRKIETAEPEAARAASFDPKRMTSAEATRKAAMLPGMVEVVVGIISSCIMPNPLVTAGMDVRSLWVALLVTVGTRLLLCRARFLTSWA
jgi:hypothetical protein